MVKTREENKVFQEVYPFTTENIGEYFTSLNLKEKDIFTVGSSLDQAFNALLFGAKNVTVFDLNANTLEFYKLKKELILSTPREELYDTVLSQQEIPMTSDSLPRKEITKVNPYLHSNQNYQKLRSKLKDTEINFVYGDIFNIEEYLKNKQYDVMILSNILQYLSFFAKTEDKYNFLKRNFNIWKKYLKDDGILQLFYLYSFSLSDLRMQMNAIPGIEIRKVYEALKGNELIFEQFNGCLPNTEDSIITYTKKR